MEQTNTVVGKDGYPTIVTTGNGHNGYGHGVLNDLITNNNVAETSREILAAIGNSTASIISNGGIHSVAALNAVNLSGVSTTKAVTDGTVSTNKSVYDGVVSSTKATTDGAVANINATNLAAVSVTKAVSDAAAAAAVAAAAAAIAAKDIQIKISDDGCKTREASAAQFAVLQKDMADAKYEALRNTCELKAKIEEICCCVEKDGNVTRTLVLAENTKRLESELADVRLKAAIAGISTKPGNS